MDEYSDLKKRGNLIIENRKKLSVTAICDVQSFEPEKIVLITEDGLLLVTGKNMHIKKISSESGEAMIEGEIAGCVYTPGKSRESFFGRMLK